MFTTLQKISSIVFAVVLASGSVWAESAASVEGMVKDSKGQPVTGAEIRVVANNAKVLSTLKTDAKGHYASQPLPAGVYKVDLLINSKPQASIGNVQVKATGLTQANFDLRLAKATASKKKRVWVLETGSNIGHWEEVDENGNVSGGGASNLSKTDSSYLRRMQDRTSGAMPQNGR
jgi:hypothetical protein